MGDIKAKLIRDEPEPCPECGTPMWGVYDALCQVCAVISYLKFRHAMDWPLDDDDKRRLGLIP